MNVLFCPAHYVYDDTREGSELSWAYNIVDRIGALTPSSTVITGRSTVRDKPYWIVEVTPGDSRVNFGLVHALAFNTRYTRAAFQALRDRQFDVFHHVLPFAIGKTYNLAGVRYGSATPFVIGPVQPPVAVRDADRNPSDLASPIFRDRTPLRSLRASATHRARSFVADVVAPLALSALYKKTISSAAAVIAVNEEARSLLIRSGVPAPRVVVIPPGVDSARFRPSERRRLPLGAPIKLLSVGNLVKRKNVDVIIRAFARLAQTAPQTRLRIVGAGPEQDALRKLSHNLNVGSAVSFAGFVPNDRVHEEYQRAHIFVNASAAEGFSTVCLEALASGLPVVSTRVGGFVDAVEDQHNGYLLEEANAEELAATLGPLVQDSELIETQSCRARERAELEFDWDLTVIPAYRDVYDRVIREHSRYNLSPSGD